MDSEEKAAALGLFPCVKVSPLPTDTGIPELLQFFVGLGPVLDIVFREELDQREAVVLFGSMMDYHGALQRYSLELNGQYVNVQPALRGDFYQAITATPERQQQRGKEQQVGAKVAAQGGAEREDNKTMRIPPKINNLVGGNGAGVGSGSGLHAGQATAPGSSQGQGQGPNHQGGGPGPAPGAPSQQGAGAGSSSSSAPVVKQRAPSRKVSPVVAGGKGSGDAKGSVIRLRGLPWGASRGDIIQFFRPGVVAGDGVTFVTRGGRATGEAYVRFASRDDAKVAMKKNREMIGNR
ncbi:unnamed protein product [Chrysoparadoxa australica]